MRVSDIFSFAFGSIKLRKLRAGLTILGVVIGIAAIVALLSITQGLQDSITNQLETGFATDTLIVVPRGTGGLGFRGGGGAGTGFSLLVNDTATINTIDNVATSVAVIEQFGYIQNGAKSLGITVQGIDFASYAAIYNATFVAESGTIPENPNDTTILVGKRINDPGQNGTVFVHQGDEVAIKWINGTTRPPTNETYTGHVSGVLKEVGGFGLGGPSDSDIYIPIDKAESFFNTKICSMIIVRLKNDDKAAINATSIAIRKAFDGQVNAISSTAVIDILSTVFSTISLFLVGIAAISLLVAGIGIMNIMIVSLMERTREIGILKALGMKNRTVLTSFLFESVIIGLFGAVIGIIAGWGLARIVALFLGRGALAQQANQNQFAGTISIMPVLTPAVLLGAVVFGIGISVIFAVYPALRASRLKPVEALRYE